MVIQMVVYEKEEVCVCLVKDDLRDGNAILLEKKKVILS